MPGPSGFDVALIQAQLVCLVVSFALVMATMVRGSAFPDAGWHWVRACGRRGDAARRARPPARGKPSAPHDPPPPAPRPITPAQPMIIALTFSTYLKLQGLTKSAKDAR